MKKLIALLLMLCLLAGSVPALAAKTVKTKKLRLSPKGSIELNVGETRTLKATRKPRNSTQKVKWSSSDPSVATVKGGVVTAVAEGSATITARSGSRKASVQVTVHAPDAPVPEPAADKALVAYFSCTGTTAKVARSLASAVGADLYEIVPAQPYTAADLDYGDDSTRATWEQNHPDTRPALGGADVDLSGYATLYLGYPIWWGMAPRALCTFVEKHDFTGMTVIPFCTSGSSGIGGSGAELEKLAGTGKWLKGARHSGSISEKELKTWAEGLK